MAIELAPVSHQESLNDASLRPPYVRQAETRVAKPANMVTASSELRWEELKFAALAPKDSATSTEDPIKAAYRQSLQSKDFQERYEAIKAICDYGDQADKRAALPALLEMFKDSKAYASDPQGNNMGRYVEWCVDAADTALKQKAALAFKDALGGGNGELVELIALRGLARSGDQAAPAMDRLVWALDQKWGVGGGRYTLYAITALANIDPDKALPYAIKGMEDQSPTLRTGSLKVIATKASQAQAARFLLKARNIYGSDKNLDTRFEAGRVMYKALGHERAYPLFLKDVSSPDKSTKETGLRLMGICGNDGLPVLQKHINDNGYQWACLYAISYMGPLAKPLLPQVEKFLNDGNKDIRMYATWAHSAITKPKN